MHGSLHGVGDHDACQRVVVRRPSDIGLEGLVLVVIYDVGVTDKLTYHAPELLRGCGFRLCFFLLLFFGLASFMVILTGSDTQAETAHQRGHQPKIDKLFHVIEIC